MVSDADTGEVLADLIGDGAEVIVARRRSRRARQRRAGLGRAQGPGLRAARRGGRDPYGHPRAQGRRRRRSGRLPERRQVVADRRHLAGPAQDRRLPVHHADPQPRRHRRRRDHLHRRRRARADRGRQRGPRSRLRLPPPHRALRRAGPRHRLRHLRARARPAHRSRRDRGRAERARRARGPAPAGRAEQDRRARRRRPGRDRRRRHLRAAGYRVFPISTKTGDGSAGADVRHGRARRGPSRRAAGRRAAADRAAARGRSAGRPSSVISPENEIWRVRGDKPERWVRQTDFGNAEAVGYLADRLNRIGIEDKLLELGARAGDGVAIGGENAVVFDFAPQVDIGAEILSPPRRGPALHRGPPGRRPPPREGQGLPLRRRAGGGLRRRDRRRGRAWLTAALGPSARTGAETAAWHRCQPAVCAHRCRNGSVDDSRADPRRPPGRGQGRLVVADHDGRRDRPGPDRCAGRRAGRRRDWPGARSSWCRPGPSPPGSPRSG